MALQNILSLCDCRAEHIFSDTVLFYASLLFFCCFIRITWLSGFSTSQTNKWLCILIFDMGVLGERALREGLQPHTKGAMAVLWTCEAVFSGFVWLFSLLAPER
ncbi:hypothetical protein QBC33DRAFT_209993 [Phialemonium atrogriseum]|uniref:Uncharacterized protein n=1 Tax=Phialemonium atrogriseum TaxID=1093897 RepID=A0AAJ0FCT4_9PEZI|nr:uncharacterized protein QBC33DRAFT_209993 [Phialemonium atrogriseum]KAK1763916.1 hypothetical protein QBC33DRAFT_209993 [Phialemonium atrogriseum]